MAVNGLLYSLHLLGRVGNRILEDNFSFSRILQNHVWQAIFKARKISQNSRETRKTEEDRDGEGGGRNPGGF